MYPEYVEIDGIQYKLNTDYRYALACFEVINDITISDTMRALAVISILYGKEDKNGQLVGIPDNLEKALELAQKFLTCNKPTENSNEKRDMDFNYDKSYIFASFMSDYKIDIDAIEMHFWKYCELIAGLTESSVLSRIRELRNTDLNDYKDIKTKNKIKKAMEQVALPNEIEKQNEINGLSDEQKNFINKLSKINNIH